MYIRFVMKKTNLLLIALFGLASMLHAEVLFTEDFDYASGTSLTSHNDWFLQWGGASNMLAVEPGLEFAGYPGSGIGNALLIEGDYSNDMPHHVFPQVTSGDVYVAVLMEPTFVTKNGYFLTLRDEHADNTAYNYCGRVYAGVDDDYNNVVGLRFFKKAEAVFDETVHLESDKTYLLVLRYHIVDGANNDEVSLYLFDQMPTAMSDKPLIGPLTDPQAPDINPAHVVFHSYDDDGFLTVDGLRVATTFEDAVGIEAQGWLSTSSTEQPAKQLHHGQLRIIRNNTIYTPLGQISY